MADGLARLGDSADALCVVNHYQRIVRWNAGAERLVGYSAVEVLNRPCHEVIGGSGRDGRPVCGPNCHVRKAVDAGELPSGHDVQVSRRDGRRIWLHLAIIVLPEEPGPLTLHLLQDVSESRHATEVMREVASLCHSHRLLPDGGAVADADGAAISGPRTLTWREREVLRLLGNGLSNSAIAVGLGVSVHTVRNHVHHILGKCRAHNRAEAVSLALRGLLL